MGSAESAWMNPGSRSPAEAGYGEVHKARNPPPERGGKHTAPAEAGKKEITLLVASLRWESDIRAGDMKRTLFLEEQ
jgi:hypothetical protein